MKPVSRLAVGLFRFTARNPSRQHATSFAEPLPLKRAVELALSHSTTTAAANADEQRVIASYREARNQYIPQLVVGSGLGKSWGFPLSLEGAAPSILNVNSQSTIFNPATRDFVPSRKD